MATTTLIAKSLVKILFIGNSFTARNDLPGLVAHLAEQRGCKMEYKLISVGGASLRNHWNTGEALKEIQANRYDYVVLQEQSTLPIKNAQRMRESVLLFDEAIKKSGAKTVLYLTWARQHAPETQQAITDAYTSIGKEIGALVVPVGVVWEKFIRKHKQPMLHDPDQSHPSPAGSYLAACVFLTMLFHENPIGCTVELKGLSQANADLLQKAAWDACPK